MKVVVAVGPMPNDDNPFTVLEIQFIQSICKVHSPVPLLTYNNFYEIFIY